MYTLYVLGCGSYINFNAGLPKKEFFLNIAKHIIACIIGYYVIHFLDMAILFILEQQAGEHFLLFKISLQLNKEKTSGKELREHAVYFIC